MNATPHLTAVAVSLARSRVARQGIHDREGRVVAHELLFRGDHEDGSGLEGGWVPPPTGQTLSGQDRATSQVIAATFGDFGVHALGGGQPLYLNMTRGFLLGELPLPFGPEGVVLEVLEHITVDDELLAGVRRLKDRGFRIAMDDFIGEPRREALLPLVDVVKVDVLDGTRSPAELLDLARRGAPRATLLAERVEDQDLLQACLDAGFELFQGYVFRRPSVLETQRLSPAQVTCLRLLRLLADPTATTAQIEQLVAHDPGLSLRVLRTANSASSAQIRSISSLRQAVVLLGPPALSAWVMLTLMGGLAARRRDDLMTVLARATCCSLIGEQIGVDPSTAYTAGLLSAAAEVLQADVGEVAAGAGMDETVTAALVDGLGPLGAVLRAVEAHEAGAEDAAVHCGVSTFDLSRAYLSAWSTALAAIELALDH